MSEESGFLSRWAKRKQAALRGEELAQPAPPVAEAPPVEQLPAPEPAPEPVAEPVPEAVAEFDPASLPPIDLLNAASDFTAFLKPGVPAALRSAALRKAWVADPLIRDYLSPLDYGWDFNAPGGLPFGFSGTLGEGAGKVLELIRQAVGEPEPPPEEGAPPPPERVPLEELPPDAPLVARAEPELAPPEPEAPEEVRPPRRHGGALPA